MAEEQIDAVATAHTLDDQAETVLHKLLRGAWTEGLSGIHPVVTVENGSILRPFLETTRAAIEQWLRQLEQPWCEDASNQDLAHTRNRIRLQLLPLLRTFNPQIAAQLARLATISTDEESYWQGELNRLLPLLLLPGKPVRGGGRSSSTHPEAETVAMEHARLRDLHPAVARRVLRAAARRLGARLNFEHTEQLLAMAHAEGARGAKLDLPGGITVERSLREIRLTPRFLLGRSWRRSMLFAFRVRLSFRRMGCVCEVNRQRPCEATLRPWRPGDRVTLKHSRRPKKVAEVLDRLRVLGAERKNWPVIESEGKIVWMRGADVDAPGFLFTPVT